MGGNPRLKKLGKKGKGDGPNHATRLEGKIVANMCWIPVYVSNPLGPDPRAFHEVKALIDTGATGSSVSKDLAKKMGLVARTKGQIHGASGVQACDIAPLTVGFKLPDGRVAKQTIPVSILPMKVPLLFGMELISAGYLVVDGPKGQWRWTLPNSSVRSPQPGADSQDVSGQ